jgi:hypothetical protein
MSGLHSREPPHGQRRAAMSGILKSLGAVSMIVDGRCARRYYRKTFILVG